LLTGTFEKAGPPRNARVKTELAESCLAVMHDSVRADFSIAATADTYSAVPFIRSWFGDSEWESLIASSAYHRYLVRDMEAALELLVRAGIADNDLYQRLESLLEDRRAARIKAGKIVERNPGLSYEVSEWLQGRSPRRASALAAESRFAQVDEQIAELLLEADGLLEFAEVLQRDSIPRLRMLDAQSTQSISLFVERATRLINTSRILGDLRNLSIHGSNDQLVQYSPLEHQLSDPNQFGAREVRIIVPSVVSSTESGSMRVVRKALVESRVKESSNE
jgi:hypothetical protein